jgi:diketogulonate reductase-like aldo/keto reductase
MDINSTIRLNNGLEMPYLGLGTYRARPGKEAYQAVRFALDAGYRHIDTAALYANEEDVGKAVRDSGIDRQDIFITTKLWNSEHGYNKAIKAFYSSLKKLGTDYVDLYLIHWPVSQIRNDSWKALEKLYSDCLCKSIGISNYAIHHVEELLKVSDIVPAVNQVEFSPFLYQKELLEYCNSKRITIQAYTPLVRGRKSDNPVLRSVSNKYGKTWAQVLIRWALQHNLVVLPKSSHKERIQENSQVFDFEISEVDMLTLDSLDEGFRVAWDPSNVN